jgi:dihydroxyacid dehydratase/phosphogluconate dehydratase
VKWNPNQDVVRPADKPITVTGGVVGLKGNLAPEGAIVKVAGLKDLKFTGPARCFDGEEACFEAVKNRAYKEGDVFVIRYEGPRGGPGMREMLSTTAALTGQGTGGKVALITDGRFSGATRAVRCRVGGAQEKLEAAAVRIRLWLYLEIRPAGRPRRKRCGDSSGRRRRDPVLCGRVIASS